MTKKLCFASVVLLFLVAAPPPSARAVGSWNGQDLYHIPLSWCIVQGSPAQASPNVAGDNTTDALIWRRHERPTDNIYVNQAGITFRSAINDAWNVLDFPIITDPDTTLGTTGDMRGEDVNVAGAEFNQMLADCDTAWAGLGRAGVGITAVNAGLFHDGTGTYVGVIGWGGCVEDVANPGFCVVPWDGQIAVVDNHYLFPTVPDRTFPDGSGLQFTLTDPFDQLVGHELGHALGLPHRNNLTALMNPGPADNVGGDGQSDNVTLNNAEVTTVRTNALVQNGLEIDPPNRIVKGNVVAARMVDKVREEGVKPSFDIASVKVTLDTRKGGISIGQRLFGLIPKSGPTQRHWFLVNSDNSERGATPAQLKRLGVPASRFNGADLVLRVDVSGGRVKGTAWQQRGDRLVLVPGGAIRYRLLALVMHPHFAPIKGRRPLPRERAGYPVHHIVTVDLPAQLAGIGLGRPFRLEALAGPATGRTPDRFAGDEIRGTEFKLEHPSFPNCFVQGDPAPGETVKIVLERLKPKAPLHGLLGARLVFRGEADEKGGGTIDFPIPRDTVPGYHLVTVGVDRTALTADCVVNVRRQ